MPEKLSRQQLVSLAKTFCKFQSKAPHPELFGVTDGKAVGTYVEHLFQTLIFEKYELGSGNSAKGIDLPGVNTDIKVTSIRQPQSSCPFKSAREKIYGLDYNLLLFVYDKKDNALSRAAKLDFVCCAYIEQQCTGDYQTTYGLLEILRRNGNRDDVIAFLEDRHLPVDDVIRNQLADEILSKPPPQGYLTISNALQWRLQYGRIVGLQTSVPGIERII
ncbi:MAG: restriction endonuclease [Verrucomicrobiota bacterium]